jgi:hypothetical protein
VTTTRRRLRRKYPDTMSDVRARLFDHLRDQIGAATDEHLTQMLKDSYAWSPQGARVLDEHLKTHPDAFTAPDPHCPRVLVRLAASMHAAGHNVVRLCCAKCGQVAVDLPRVADEGRCCEWCLTRERIKLCARCGLPGFPTAKRAEGIICRRCYNDEKVEDCAGCGKQRPPSTQASVQPLWAVGGGQGRQTRRIPLPTLLSALPTSEKALRNLRRRISHRDPGPRRWRGPL